MEYIFGAEKESINHVLFELKPVIQTLTTSKISCKSVPLYLLFSDIDYIFRKLPKEYDFNYFPCIIRYAWKNINDRVYKNKNGNSQEIFRIA